MADINKLITELQGDPGTYDALSDTEVVTSIMTEDRQRNRTSMSRSEIMQAVEPAAYNALTGDDLVAFWGLLSVDVIDPFGVEADVMIKIFSGGSATITALAAARVETISRAEELGIGTVIPRNVADARRNM